MRTLNLQGDKAKAWGEQHGESFRGEIRSLVEIRRYLASVISGFAPAELEAVAERHLPVLQAFDDELYTELLGIAHAANVSPASIVIVNHYTDLRDLRPSSGQGQVDYDGGCSMFYASTPKGPVLAQTWDMHATAAPYTIMMKVPAPTGHAWVLSVVGCLGMAGMNHHGLCIGINNLTSTDAKVGLVWPALVRRALAESRAESARDVVLAAPLGSGHHYCIVDHDHAFGIETSGHLREVVFQDGQTPYVHANHCHAPLVEAASRIPPGSTTRERENLLLGDLQANAVTDLDDAWLRLGSQKGYPRSVCTNMSTPEHPHAAATCAGIAMSVDERRLYACSGFTHRAIATEFSFEGYDG